MNTNELIKKLGDNLATLTEMYTKCIGVKDFNSAINVMKNIDMVVKQLKELDFEIMTSKYSTVDTETGIEEKELAIWKQNGFGQIKDHEVFKISDVDNCSCTLQNIKEHANKKIKAKFNIIIDSCVYIIELMPRHYSVDNIICSVCEIFDLPYMESLYIATSEQKDCTIFSNENLDEKVANKNLIREYFKCVLNLRQYKNLTYKDSMK